MSLTKFLVIVALLGYGYHYYTTNRTTDNTVSKVDVGSSSRGFVEMPAIPGASGASVVIFSPENCPEEGTRRADALAAHLEQSGVSVTRSSNVDFSFDNNDPAYVQRVLDVMNGEIPIVVVRGRGKANPTFEEVLAVYRSEAP